MAQPRILDKSQYDRKTIAIFEVISAYFTDVFYNHLYQEVKKKKENGLISSIGEGYRSALYMWIKALKTTHFYTKTIKGIHNWMLNYTKFTISYSQCIDKIVCEFIPTDYISALSNNQKAGILKKRNIQEALKSLLCTIISLNPSMRNQNTS